MASSAEHERDFVGYGRRRPDPKWPGGARVAVSLVLNYEEGAENNILEGDSGSEAYLQEIIGAGAVEGERNLVVESMYEYGSRVGFWRLQALLQAYGVPVTVFACGQALERNPEVGRAMADNKKWEIAGHGWRWIDYRQVPEEVERAHIAQTVATIEAITGRRPVGWYTGRVSANTRRLLVEEGGFLYDADSYADDLPYYWLGGEASAEGRSHLIVPYSLDCNDFKLLLPGGFSSVKQLRQHVESAITFSDGAMVSIGMHCRILGHPGRLAELNKLLAYLVSTPGVWLATRQEIAQHWKATFPPPSTTPSS